MDTLQQIRQGKITSTTQIEDLFAQSAAWIGAHLGRYETTSTRVRGYADPEGAKLGQQVDAFLAGRKPLIDKSNPMMGRSTPPGAEILRIPGDGANQDRRIQARWEGPSHAVGPEITGVLGSPEIVNQYRPTLQDSAKWLADDMARGREQNRRRKRIVETLRLV